MSGRGGGGLILQPGRRSWQPKSGRMLRFRFIFSHVFRNKSPWFSMRGIVNLQKQLSSDTPWGARNFRLSVQVSNFRSRDSGHQDPRVGMILRTLHC